jgi:hypothetical protein
MFRKIVKENVKQILKEQEEVREATSQWQHDWPSKYTRMLTERFGSPRVLSKDGYAEWINVAGFKRVYVRDEKITHNFPETHYDSVYSTREIHVPDRLYSDFANVTGSIIMDGLKKEVTARCADIVANAITLGFVEDVVAGRQAPDKKEYGRRINETVVPGWFDDPLNEIE